MAKRESILRYSLIIKRLRRSPATYKEITDYLDQEAELQEIDLSVSQRTFQRDVKEIKSIYNIDIQFDFSRKIYFIEFDQQPEISERVMEAFDIFNALNMTDRLADYIQFEKRKPTGTENLHGLLHAIKNKLQIKFIYQKYWENEITERLVDPYALKEFRNRWYVIARDTKDNIIKSFSLDRLTGLDITKIRFKRPEDFDINTYYEHCFGIVGANSEKPYDIELSFTPFQGKYIKSLPLHESQRIIVDNEDELKISLKLYLTHDFIMEVLSFGENVQVIKPKELIDMLKESYQLALNRY